MERFEEIALKEKDQSLEVSPTKYEMSLAEFPLFLLSKHTIPGLDAIVYSDKIINNTVERTWRVTWSNKYGPATQSAAETFFALFQIWAESNFETPWIHFGTIRSILIRRGVSSASQKDYKRILRDLHCLSNLYIEAKNAFYDSTKKKYVDASFHLFEGLVLEKDTEGNPDPTSRGYIKASPVLLAAARKNCFMLGIEEKRFFALPGIQQRLYLYLRKMFTFQKFHVRSLADIAHQLPLYCTTEYKVKQQIKKASQALLDADLIPSFAKFRFYSSLAGGEMIRFERSDSQQVSLFEEDNEQDAIDSNFGLIKDLCTDEHSFPFYRKVAARMATDDICRALSESKEFAHEACRQGGTCSIPKVFTSRILSIAREQGIDLKN